jgi:hypothetical protein
VLFDRPSEAWHLLGLPDRRVSCQAWSLARSDPAARLADDDHECAGRTDRDSATVSS